MKSTYFFLQYNILAISPIIAIANEKSIIYLQFVAQEEIKKTLQKYAAYFNCDLQQKETPLLLQLKQELDEYFNGTLQKFLVPFEILEGSDFQKKTWEALSSIAYGKTASYTSIAQKINHPKAVRAVGTANGKNPLALLIPCHRIIHKNNKIGGYAGGIAIKEWLLKHEQSHHYLFKI